MALRLMMLIAGAPMGPVQLPDTGCPAASPVGGEIVVCRRPDDPDQFRLKPLPDTYPAADGPPRAAWKLGDAVVGVETSQVSVGGFPSNRVMATIRIPLGGKKK